MIVIGFIVLGIIAATFFVLWRGAKQDTASAVSGREFYEKHSRKTECELRDVGKLIANGWVASKTYSGWAENWKFQASDETEPRKFADALHRQKRLDEIDKYNLPKEYEAMNDKTKA